MVYLVHVANNILRRLLRRSTALRASSRPLLLSVAHGASWAEELVGPSEAALPNAPGLLPKGSVFPIDRVPFPHDPRMAGEPGGEPIGIRREGCEPWGLPGATK